MAATPAPQRRLYIQLIRIRRTLTHNPQTSGMNCDSQDGRLDQTRQRVWSPTRNTTVFPQFQQPVADIDLDPLAQRLTFCQEQEQNSVNVASSTPVQPPGTLFHQTFMTLLIRVHSGNDSRMYFLIVLTTNYCWRSWTSRIAAPYKSRVDWLTERLFNLWT